MNSYTKLTTVIAVMFAAMSLAVIPSLILHNSYAILTTTPEERKAPIAVSGYNNVYVVWFTDKGTPNKNSEVMFKASTDCGKTFSSKTNPSNTPTVDSINAVYLQQEIMYMLHSGKEQMQQRSISSGVEIKPFGQFKAVKVAGDEWS